MHRLYPFLPLGDGESLTSFTSRLSVLHSFAPVRGFMHHLGLSFPALVIGDPKSINQLAELTNVSAKALRANAIRRDGEAFAFRGQAMLRSTMRRSRYFACPSCLADDVAGSKLPPECAVYGRAIWQFAPIRACPTHGIALQPIGEARLPSQFHDFARGVRPAIAGLERAVSEAEPVEPSRAEAYLIGRLHGGSEKSAWLDSHEWHAAARVCEMLGAVALFGRVLVMRKLTESDWYRAAKAGFAIAHGGEPSIRAFLTELQISGRQRGQPQEGPQATFGSLYLWLEFGTPHAAFQKVRDLLFRHIVETSPVGVGDSFLGHRVERRRIHSITTAAQETGRSPSRLRKVLAASGLISETHQGMSDNHVLFDAEKAKTFLTQERGGMPLAGIAEYLNMDPGHVRLIVKEGLVKPFVTHVGGRFRHASFAPEELDRFLNALMDGAAPVSSYSLPAAPILAASRRANCDILTIIRLILDKKLLWVGREQNVRGYSGVLVDIDEIKSLVKGPPLQGITVKMVRARLRTKMQVVVRLIDKGYIPVHLGINPVNRCPIRIVKLEDIEAFEDRYISISELAKRWKKSPPCALRKMTKENVQTAIKHEDVGTHFYLRKSLDI